MTNNETILLNKFMEFYNELDNEHLKSLISFIRNLSEEEVSDIIENMHELSWTYEFEG